MSYDKYPYVEVKKYTNEAFCGYESIMSVLEEKMKNKKVIVVDCYPGVDDQEVLSALKEGLNPDLVIESKNMFYDEKTLNKMMYPHLSDDRVRGVMYYGVMSDFVDHEKLLEFQQRVIQNKGLCMLMNGKKNV